MLLVKQAHEDWQQKTLLMRWNEKDGRSVMFFVTGEAYAFFNAMETMRIYEGTLRPTSVQNATRSQKYGITSNVEVYCKFPTKFTLSKTVWPLRQFYDFIDWDAFNQKDAGALIDVIGRAKKPRRKQWFQLTKGHAHADQW